MTYSQCSGDTLAVLGDILAVLEVVTSGSEPRDLSMPGLLSWQVQGGQGWNAHGVGLSSPRRALLPSLWAGPALGGLARRKSFAARPDEPVASFALISSIMPQGAGQRPQTYRIALTIAIVVAMIAAIFGAMPIAVLVAAFAVPVVYIVTLRRESLGGRAGDRHRVRLPIDRRAHRRLHDLVDLSPRTVPYGTTTYEGSLSAAPTVGFLLVALVVPIVGEAIRQIGPVLPLASRPEFDDLMDGLTWRDQWVSLASTPWFAIGIYLTGGLPKPRPWPLGVVDLLEGLRQAVIIGTAGGIAVAEFSGLGRGYDGFTPRYFRGVGEAILANAAYQAGTYLFSFVGDATLGVVLSILWGLIILAILILRVRNVLHVGLMEAALERLSETAVPGRVVRSSTARSARCRCWSMPPSATPAVPQCGCKPSVEAQGGRC